MSFVLDERLRRDTLFVGDFPLSRVLLMNDARWPWLVLVPRRHGLVELTDLETSDRAALVEEAAKAVGFLKALHRVIVATGFHERMGGPSRW